MKKTIILSLFSGTLVAISSIFASAWFNGIWGDSGYIYWLIIFSIIFDRIHFFYFYIIVNVEKPHRFQQTIYFLITLTTAFLVNYGLAIFLLSKLQ